MAKSSGRNTHSRASFFPSWFGTAILGVMASAVTAARSGAAGPAEKARQFRAGAATSNITPRLGVSINGYFNDRIAKHIHDELHARCLVLDDGRTRLALAICDSCMIPRELMDAAKQLIQQRTGIAADHVLIAATHTHTAPTCVSLLQSEADA